MEQLKVGNIYPQFKRSDCLMMGYGPSGLRLVFVLCNPDDEEIDNLKSGRRLEIRMGIFGKYIVWCVKPGTESFSDCSFAPGLQPDLPYDLVIPENQGLGLTVELYDGDTGELKALRLVSLPHDFSMKFLENCRKLLTLNATPDEIATSYAAIVSRNTTQLVYMCDTKAVIGGD